jgi:hypothetical protein
MALTMRPTGLGHGVYKDDPDFVVYSGGWQIGRIYERRRFSGRRALVVVALWRCFDPPRHQHGRARANT